MLRNSLFVLALTLALASASHADSEKVEVCHNGRTLDVAIASVAAHQRHGDVACTCEAIEECSAAGGILDEAGCECAPEEPYYPAFCICGDPAAGAAYEIPTGACVTEPYCKDDLYDECIYFCLDLGYLPGGSFCDVIGCAP